MSTYDGVPSQRHPASASGMPSLFATAREHVMLKFGFPPHVDVNRSPSGRGDLPEPLPRLLASSLEWQNRSPGGHRDRAPSIPS